MASNETMQKLKAIGFFFLIVFLILLGRLGQLQIIQSEKYRYLSEGNRIDYRPVPSSRGRIWVHGNDGYTIAVSNRMAYTASVIPANIRGTTIEEVAGLLGVLLDMEPSEIILRLQQGPRTVPVRIKRNLVAEELVVLEEHIGELPGVIIERIPIRDYVYGSMAAHIFGYVGEISRDELNHFFAYGYRPGDLVGKTGLERYYEVILRGEDGLRQIEVNNRHLEVATLGMKPPVQGIDLYLTIDLPLQQEMERLLKEHIVALQEQALTDPDLKGGPTGGSAVVLDPATGRILAMASYPTFNLNPFAEGINPETLRDLQQNPCQPFLDRVIQITPPPGSVFKVITGFAALEELGLNPLEKLFHCPGSFQIGNYTWRCWHEGGHGSLSFYEALAYSCNVAFYQMGQMLNQLGSEAIQRLAREFGFGYLAGVDLPSERAGLVPDRAWKREARGEPWVPGDTINLSIGQGSLLVTPLQVANMVMAIANDGLLVQPYIVEKAVSSNQEVIFENNPRILNELDVTSRAMQIMREALEHVTSYGTGARTIGDFPIKVAGKTGTAQTVTALDAPNHGWFAGYAPASDPEVAFAVFIEHGNDSRHAISVARGILIEYFGLEEVGED